MDDFERPWTSKIRGFYWFFLRFSAVAHTSRINWDEVAGDRLTVCEKGSLTWALAQISSFLPLDLRGPAADCRETVPHDAVCVRFYNLGPQIWGLRISPKRIETSKIGKLSYWLRFLPRSTEKSLLNFDPLTKSTFSENQTPACEGLCLRIFTRASEWPRLASARLIEDGGFSSIFAKLGHKLAVNVAY